MCVYVCELRERERKSEGDIEGGGRGNERERERERERGGGVLEGQSNYYKKSNVVTITAPCNRFLKDTGRR